MAEKADGVGDVVDAADSADGNTCEHRLAEFGLLQEGTGAGSHEVGGSNGIDGDTQRCPFEGHTFREHVQRGLGGRIGDVVHNFHHWFRLQMGLN